MSAVVVAAMAMTAMPAAASPASPVGRWLTQGDEAIVEIAPCGAALCGTLRRILKPDPGAPKTDVHNPDLLLRGRPADSLTILTGFVAKDRRWQGSIYDPRSGRTYRSFVEVRGDGTLALSGCVWALCRTQTWRRLR